MRRKLTFGILAIALQGICALAQGPTRSTGTVHGTVFIVDDDGGRSVIPSVKVSLTGRTHIESQSDDRGNFSFDSVTPGGYMISAEAPGMAGTLQERIGERIALAAEINIAGIPITTYNLHLESRANDDLRLAQLDEVLRDASKYSSGRPLILAGDLNPNAAKTGPAEKISGSGFCSAVPSAQAPTTPARHLLESGRHIDWAFLRGPMRPDKGRVHNAVKASDHYPISFDIRKDP